MGTIFSTKDVGFRKFRKQILNRFAGNDCEGMTACQALEHWSMDYRAEMAPHYYEWDGEKRDSGYSTVINARNGDPLGVVSDGYKIFQPLDFAKFADKVASEITNGGDYPIVLEGASNCRNRINYLFRMGTEPGELGRDQWGNFLHLSTGLGGLHAAVSARYFGVRYICTNGMIGLTEAGELAPTISIKHSSVLEERLEEAIAGINSIYGQQEKSKRAYRRMSVRKLDRVHFSMFLLECWAYDRKIDESRIIDPSNPKEKRQGERFHEFLREAESLESREREELGLERSIWTALQAYTNLQFSRKPRKGRTIPGQVSYSPQEIAIYRNMFGANYLSLRNSYARAGRWAVTS